MKKRKVKSVLAALIKSPVLRLNISLLSGLLMNSLYIAANLLPAVRYGSAWSLAVTLYYAVLAVLRVFLLLARRDRVYPLCLLVGRLLLFLDGAIGAVMVYTVLYGKIINYPSYIFIAFGIFTAYSVTGSALGVVRSLRRKSPYTLAARNLTLAAALLSLFNLGYTLLVTLGAGHRTVLLLNILGGGFFVLLIGVLAVRLISVVTVKMRG